MLSIGRRAGSRNLKLGDQPGADQKMIRRQALIRRGIRIAPVEHHQLVQHRRARAPVADDEDRRVLDLRALEVPPKEQLLQRSRRAS